ncbi:ABC transporter substrate-binding protein [Actinosynnema sp. NPDC050436]|uniref:ABC transporter substrate-binding protein n=1 Tax=Actinosynnema sp. NPDC050436 TaxID=3155659 RepID=UPI00340F5C8A
MSTSTLEQDRIWYTRCPVPTASGLAHDLGWLAEEFAADGLDVGVLQDAPPDIAARHFDHRLVGLFREGGNVPALVARSEGAPTRLIGLTWIDESQLIVVRPGSGITAPEHLAGRRVALPAFAADRARSFPRAMALHGFAGALRAVGLSLADVVPVEVPTGQGDVGRGAQGGGSLFGIEALARGEVDAVYVKGARAAEEAAAHGLVTGVDLDAFADRRFRVNNGTPRPITVHEQILAERPDLVARFLFRTLRAADWAAVNLDRVREILARETRSGPDGVAAAYRDGFHESLHPDLSPERLELLTRQKDFLLAHGFLARDVDVRAWAAHEPLAGAHALLEAGR